MRDFIGLRLSDPLGVGVVQQFVGLVYELVGVLLSSAEILEIRSARGCGQFADGLAHHIARLNIAMVGNDRPGWRPFGPHLVGRWSSRVARVLLVVDGIGVTRHT